MNTDIPAAAPVIPEELENKLAKIANRRDWEDSDYKAGEDFLRELFAGNGDQFPETYPGLTKKRTARVRKLYDKYLAKQADQPPTESVQ